MSGVTIHINHAAADALVKHVSDLSVHAAAARTQNRAKTNLTAADRIATGKLRDSIVIHRESPAVYTVRAEQFYAMWQEIGRGPVVAIRAKVLRFKPKGSSVFIFRKRVGPASGSAGSTV